jgi:tetratricopeptide (TPR) repeat protein
MLRPGPSDKPGGEEGFVARRRGELTFNKDIAPIIHRHCSTCHRPGEAAPFNLLTYQDVKKRAPDIVQVTARRYMPPWLPDRSGPALRHERHLTENEIGMIRQWAAEGVREGAERDKQPLPTWPEGWQLGTPDLVVEMPVPYALPEAGRDVYRNFVIPLHLEQRRYVRAVEFRANTKVIHHVFLRFDRSQQSRRLDAQDTEVGFGGMTVPPGVESPGGHFLSWQPGRGPIQFPDGLAWPLEPKRDLVLQAHMQPAGKRELVQPRIGFYFTEQAPTNTPFKMYLSSIAIDIPAGARDYEIQDTYVLPVDVDLLAVLPHAHYLARQMEGYAILPTGEYRSLLRIKDWDFNWQSDYRYDEPVTLPKGTRLGMRFTYDNSTANVRNPNHPPNRVRYGLQSTDEMGELWLQLLARNREDLRALEGDCEQRFIREILAYNERAIQENPTNAHAHVQLAKALMTMGRSSEALPHLKQGVQIDPKQEEGHYHIGVLLMDSDPALAVLAFAETIRLNPENFKAHNNLGLVLMRTGRLREAEAHFRSALTLNPNDPMALENMRILKSGF